MTETIIPLTIINDECESRILNLINAFVNRIVPLESILFESFYGEIEDTPFDKKDLLLIASIIDEELTRNFHSIDIEGRALALRNGIRFIARNR